MEHKKKTEDKKKDKDDIYDNDTSLRQQDLEKIKPQLKPKHFHEESL